MKPQLTLRAQAALADVLDFVLEDACASGDVKDSARFLYDYFCAEAVGVKDHVCVDVWSAMYRMALARAEGDTDAYALVAQELDYCRNCWGAMLYNVMGKYTSFSVLHVGGTDKLADVLTKELARLVMPEEVQT